jgi:flagellin-like protein
LDNLEDDKIRIRYFNKDERAVSPVIAVILLVAMTVVLVAVLYYSVSGMIDQTKTSPVGAFHFREDENIDGKYTGSLISVSAKVKLTDVGITVVDGETGESGTIFPLIDLGSTNAGPGGSSINVSYDDIGKIGMLDASDAFFVTGATHGDKILLIFIPSDDLIATWTTPI